MRSVYLSPFNLRAARAAVVVAAGALLLSMAAGLRAQVPQLSLADLLIGLRSKKVTLEERNRILAEAVKQRGITFELTGEIEKELSTTGADKGLIAAIRLKDAPVKKPSESAKTAEPQPVATPTPPDFAFYKSRADVNALKGDFNGALTDYSKSLELKPDNSVVLFSRGQTYFNLKSYDLSVADFTKAAEINPKDSMTYVNRAMSFEKMGDNAKAMADYQKAVELDAANDTAKAALKRMQDEEARLAAAKAQPQPAQPVAAAPAPAPEPVKAPEFISLGALSAANAVKLVMPVYPVVAQKSNIEGKVAVDVTLDEDGEVVEAKATNGHALLRSAAEDAAARSKFKPAKFNNKPIKSKGTIVYNFSIRQGR